MDNLICAGDYTNNCDAPSTTPNTKYMSIDFEKYNKAVNTYSKLQDAYRANDCKNNLNTNKTVNIALSNADFKNNIASNISTTCADLNGNLITFTNNISKCADRYTNDIQNDLTAYNNDKTTLLRSYSEMKTKREKLDQDVLKVLGADNSPLYEKQGILDSAVYTTLLWTVLATSALYYTFTKI